MASSDLPSARCILNLSRLVPPPGLTRHCMASENTLQHQLPWPEWGEVEQQIWQHSMTEKEEPTAADSLFIQSCTDGSELLTGAVAVGGGWSSGGSGPGLPADGASATCPSLGSFPCSPACFVDVALDTSDLPGQQQQQPGPQQRNTECKATSTTRLDPSPMTLHTELGKGQQTAAHCLFMLSFLLGWDGASRQTYIWTFAAFSLTGAAFYAVVSNHPRSATTSESGLDRRVPLPRQSTRSTTTCTPDHPPPAERDSNSQTSFLPICFFPFVLAFI